IGHDTTFDDQVNNFGCQVFMFDPTVNQDTIRRTNNKNQHFYLLGLDASNYNLSVDLKYTDNKTETIVGELDTFDSIRSRLGHQHLPVHYLKLDIENSEWRVLPYMLERGLLHSVKQLAIEVHTLDIISAPQHRVLEMLEGYLQVLQGLRKEGFLRVSYRPTVVLETLYHVP
ncbi:hypothetical protein OTU49_012807, partial [Cherax quadricarinatus]